MIATEICPFDDPEYLTAIADDASSQITPKRSAITNQLLQTLNQEQRRLLTELDNLSIAEVVDVQAATIRKTICEPCRRRGLPCKHPQE